MALTAERYIPDSGSVKLNATEVNGSIKTVSVNAPRRNSRLVNSLGGTATELQSRVKSGNYEYSLDVIDDQSLNNTASGALGVLYDSYENGTAITSLSVVPAGSTAGMAEYTFGDISVVQCPPHGQMDADSDEESVATVVIEVGTITIGAAA
jgi:hypothetical protein